MAGKTTRWGPEQLKAAKDAVTQLGSIRLAADALGCTEAALRGILHHAGVLAADLIAKRPMVPPAPPKEDPSAPSWLRYRPPAGWKEPEKAKAAKAAKTEATRTLVFADAHHPYASTPAWSCLLGILRDYRPHRVVNLGDFMETESLSRHPKSKPDVVRLSAEYYAANVALDALQNAAPIAEHYYLEGNHENRAVKFANEWGMLDGVLSVPQSLFLEANPDHYHRRSEDSLRGMKWIPLALQPFGIDGNGYLHGVSEAKHHAASTADELGPSSGYRTLFMGHMHGEQVFRSKAGFAAYATPWLGDRNHAVFRAYTKGRPRPWSHGCWLVESCDGAQSVTLVPIVNGRALVGGKSVAA